MKKLLSFHGKQEIKDKYIIRVKAHALADEIMQGKYWENGKGCAVGCTVHSGNHNAYEEELGIPKIIARLEDRIFENLSNKDAKTFPLEFLEAIPVGVDLEPVWRKFLIWLLVDAKEGVILYAKKSKTKKIIQKVADLLTKSLTTKLSPEELEELRKIYAYAAYAADDAAYAVASTTRAAAYAAYAYEADTADDAYTAYAAYAAANAYTAYAYAAANAYTAAAKRNKYKTMRKKLIQLLKEA